MKKLLKKFNSLFMIMLLLAQTFSPYIVKAAEGDPLIGQLKLPGSTVYSDRVEVIEGDTLTGDAQADQGKVQVKKIVRAAKPSDPGYKADGTAYVVEFQLKGVPYEQTKNAYVVVVFDRSGSMICDGNRNSYSWTSKSDADTYAANHSYGSYGNRSDSYKLDGGSSTTIYCSKGNDDKSGVIANKWESAVNGGVSFSSNILTQIPTSYVSLVTFSSSAANATAFSRNAFTKTSFSYPYGSTALADGINKARTALNSSSIKQNDEKVIVIISDGEPTVPSSTAVSSAKTAADNAKNAGITIYTIGYQVPASTENYANLTENSAAESVLKNIASKNSSNQPYYYAATTAESLNPIFSSIAEKIVESFNAGSNPHMNDNLGSAFSVSAGNNNFTYTGVIPEEWTTIGSFTMEINPDAADNNGGWKNTNSGFSLTYDTPNKDSNGNIIQRTITVPEGDDPLVYWPQRTYNYRVEYYYEDMNNLGNYTHDASLDETYNDSVTLVHGDDVEKVLLHLGTPISVANATINDSTHKKTGYIFDANNSLQHISATIVNSYDTNANVLKVYYDLEPLTYVVKHFKQNATGSTEYTEVEADREALNIKYNQTATYSNKTYEGYTYVSSKDAKNKDTLVVTDNELVISLYYDIQQYDYKIVYHYEGASDVTDTGTKDYGEKVTLTDQMINDHMTNGYKLRETNPITPASREITISTNVSQNEIHVYYVVDETVTKEVKYTVEYYKDNQLVSSDTENYKKDVQVLEPNTIDVDKTKINTTDKYGAGYHFVKTNPETIPDTVESGTTIKVYYEKNSFAYSKEYYYDGVIDNSKTETGTALFDTQISGYTDNLIDGYKLDHVENDPLTITTNVQENVMKIYYVKDSFAYSKEYYYDGVIDNSKTETGTALFGSQISGYTNNVIEGYKLDHVEKDPLTITSNPNNNKMKIYYVRDTFNYTVEYYYENVIDNNETVTSSALFNERITRYTDKVRTGYELDKTEGLPLTITANPKNNVIKVYYKLRVCQYNVNYYYDGVQDDTETEVLNAKYGSEIKTYENKIRDGYKLDKEENLPLTVGLNASENNINIYYVKDSFAYSIEYYYDNVIDSSKTEAKTAEFDSVIDTYPDKNIEGYRLDKEVNKPLTITSNPENNVMKIYYVIDDENTKTLKYTVEYYKDNTLVSGDTDTESITVQILQPNTMTVNKTKINTTDKYDGYKFDHTNPETIPDTVETGSVIKVYYVKDSFEYSVEYYYDNQIDSTKTETKSAEFDSVIDSYTDKNIEGYKLDKEVNKPLTITSKPESNVMKIYYVKDSFQYTVEYYYENQIDSTKTETNYAIYKDVISTYTDKLETGYEFDKTEGLPLTISANPKENVIKVYYKLKVCNYSIKYYYDGIVDENETISDTAKYGEKITDYTDKVRFGYRLEKEENLPLTVGLDATKNIINIYYVIDENNTKDIMYTVEYYKNGVLVGEDTEEVKKTVQVLQPSTLDVEKDNINLTDKYVGYTYDHFEVVEPSTKRLLKAPINDTLPDTVKDKTVIKVFYVINEYDYTVEYYLQNTDGEYDLNSDETVINHVTYGTKTEFEEKSFDNYTLNTELTENNGVEVTDDGIIVKVYYDLGKSNIIVHYVVSDVDDGHYTLFSEFAIDPDGNVIEPFEGLDLEDADIEGYVGSKTNLEGRQPTEFIFLGIYENGELISEDENYEAEFDIETRELTYVYQAPAGDIPPHTGIDDEVNNNALFSIMSIVSIMTTGMYFIKREQN